MVLNALKTPLNAVLKALAAALKLVAEKMLSTPLATFCPKASQLLKPVMLSFSAIAFTADDIPPKTPLFSSPINDVSDFVALLKSSLSLKTLARASPRLSPVF